MWTIEGSFLIESNSKPLRSAKRNSAGIHQLDFTYSSVGDAETSGRRPMTTHINSERLSRFLGPGRGLRKPPEATPCK